MANKRMFSLDVVDADRFLDMPTSTRLLYYDLGMRADDDGFVQSVQKILRFTGATKDDVNVLISRGFVIPFESGVLVIRHWRLNNEIKKDRYRSTVCLTEKAQLRFDESKIYERQQSGSNLEAAWNQSGSNLEAQISLGKKSIGEVYAHAREAAPAAPPSPGLLSEDELTALSDDHDRAQLLIRRYGLPDSYVTLDALLEDAQARGWEDLEAALKTASLSNSRKGLSVNFYRAVLNGAGAKSGGDPYAGFECL